MRPMLADRLQKEIESFEGLWQGGYFVGDPLDPMGRSAYRMIGYMSVLHATYLACIKPYVKGETVVLEIGPGRGAWTKVFLPAQEVWCLDALPAEHNHFWEYIGRPSNVRYFQVRDFRCQMLPDNKFDYLFSFGCFCHISFDGIREYMKNLYPKLRRGTNCFVMVADYDKYNAALDNLEKFSVARAFPAQQLNWPLRFLWNLFWRMKARDEFYTKRLDPAEGETPTPGRWYHAGVGRTCDMLEDFGYKVICPDVGTNLRDPIIHFTK